MEIKYFDSVGEILRMGEPHLSKVAVDGVVLEGFFVQQKVVANSDRTLYLLVKIRNYYPLDAYFSIYILNSSNNEIWISKNDFRYLFVDDIIDDTITYYEAFHNELSSNRRQMVFSKDQFSLVSE